VLTEGIKVGNNGIELCLLQFADDALFFCKPKYECIMAIKSILQCFEIMFGLKVNFHKSSVGSIGVDEGDLSIFSNCLNGIKMKFPFKYLGMTIGGNQRTIPFWKPSVEKIKSRLSKWRGRILSMAGRVCLLKVVINSLSLFYLSFLKPLVLCVI